MSASRALMNSLKLSSVSCWPPLLKGVPISVRKNVFTRASGFTGSSDGAVSVCAAQVMSEQSPPIVKGRR